MSVLGHEQIKDRSEEIFSENYDENQLQPAAYELRVSTTEAKIKDKVYTMDENYREENENAERKRCFDLPARRISVISSKEKLSLPNDICARVGIRLTFSKEGLIPLFGPQVDPGYHGRFYAVIYNASGESVEIHQKDEAVFKMILEKVEGSKVEGVERDSIDYITELDLDDFNDGLTDLSDIKSKFDSDLSDIKSKFDSDLDVAKRELENKINVTREGLNEKIEENEKDVSTAKTTITEVKKGYREVVLFGVFLLATSSFGVVYSIIIKSIQADGFNIGKNFGTAVTFLFLGGWLIGIVALLLVIFRGRATSDDD